MNRKISHILLLFCGFFWCLNLTPACGDTAIDNYDQARRRMIEYDLKGRDIHDPVVLNAMQKVPRHLFVPKGLRSQAYRDNPLPVGEDQTISQPYIVALMSQSLNLKKTDKVLEIGTGSGYQAAVLAEIVSHVYTIEIIKKLADRASDLLVSLRYKNVSVKAGDGFFGWPQQAPFDAVIITAAAKKIPQPLIAQLKEGGRIIMPLGGRFQVQRLVIGTKKGGKLDVKNTIPVRFVPMTGEAEK